MHQRPWILGVCLLAVCLAVPAAAQTGTSRIVGVVKDATGAVVPGATVRATHESTGIVSETVTNETGGYVHHPHQQLEQAGGKGGVVEALRLPGRARLGILRHDHTRALHLGRHPQAGDAAQRFPGAEPDQVGHGPPAGIVDGDDHGRTRGMVVLNYLGQRLRDKLGALEGNAGKIWLLNAEGYWLVGPTPEDEWGFALPARSQRSLAKRFPRLWQQVNAEKSGVHQKATSWVRFERIYPLLGGSIPADFAKPVWRGRSRRLRYSGFAHTPKPIRREEAGRRA